MSLSEKAVQNDDFLVAVSLLEEAENEMAKFLSSQKSKVAGVFEAKLADLRYTIAASLTDCWKTLIHVDPIVSKISIKDQIRRRYSRFLPDPC